MLNVPSHILIDPQTLGDALAGAYHPSQPGVAGALSDMQMCIEALIQEHVADVGGDDARMQALRATRNLLAVIREAVGADDVEGQAAREAWRPYHLASTLSDFVVVVTREAHQVAPGTRLQVTCRDGAELWWFAEDESGRQSSPMRVDVACRHLNDWRAQVIVVDANHANRHPDTWLALIDRVLETLVGLGWGPEGTEAARCLVGAILNDHESLEALRARVQPGDDLTWLDVIDDALVEAGDLVDFDAGMSEEALGEVHGLVQGILTGHVPVDHLLREHALALTAYTEGGGVG